VVCVAYLLGLKIYAGSFETSQWWEVICLFSQDRHLLGLSSWVGVPCVKGPGSQGSTIVEEWSGTCRGIQCSSIPHMDVLSEP
jgi:hypothetical protein